jgi:hypothetical protein
MENVEYFKTGWNRWAWVGCRHASGFPTLDAARTARALYATAYDESVPRRTRNRAFTEIDKLAWPENYK